MSQQSPLSLPSLPRLVWGVLVRPRATLEVLNQQGQRAWWLPAALVALVLVLPIVVAAPLSAQQAREALAVTQEQWGSQMSPADASQMERAASIVSSPLITVVFPSVGGLVGLVVVWLAWASALYLLSLAVGGRSNFGQMVRMVVWAWLPYALRGLLQSIYILATGQLIAHPGLSGLVADDRALSEVVLAPPSLGQMLLTSFLSRLDLFLVWNLALLVVGVGVVARLPRQKALLVTIGVWLVITVLGLLPALVSGFLGQQAVIVK